MTNFQNQIFESSIIEYLIIIWILVLEIWLLFFSHFFQHRLNKTFHI